jgi:actin-related protein
MGILKLRYPIKNGVFQNERDILTVFNHIYTKLEVKSEEIKEHPVFITEPILNPYSHRKQVAAALLENLTVPAIFFGSQPILSLFSSSDKSGIILESGEGITQCSVVYEGYVIPHSNVRYDFGGRNVTEFLQNLLKRAGHSFHTTVKISYFNKY